MGAPVLEVVGLNDGAAPWLVRFSGDVTPDAVLRVGNASDLEVRELFDTELAALRLTTRHGVPAPRLLAARLGDTGDPGDIARPHHDPGPGEAAQPDAVPGPNRQTADGRPDRYAQPDAAEQLALLTTVVSGSSTIPREATEERLRNLGAAAAAVAAVIPTGDHGLSVRNRPIESVDFASMRRAGDSTPLLNEADALMARLPRPDGPTVLVHGDLWQANMMWDGDQVVGLIDWDCAGVGHPGVDLGSARLDAALMFGQPATAPVLDGWCEATDHNAGEVAYWDVVAALSTPTDLGYFMAVIHRQGRADLTQDQAIERRDTFLRAALDQLR